MPATHRPLIALLAFALLTAGGTASAQSGGRPATHNGSGQQASAKRQPLFRHSSIDAAWQAAQKSGRPVLVYVTSKQCHYCEKMLKETWSNPQIARAVSQQFEPVAVLKENDPALVKRLGVRAFPTTVVVTPKGELANHIRGFANPQKFASIILMPKTDRLSVQPASYGGQAHQPPRR